MEEPGAQTTRPVSSPALALPDGAWDCHAHVFGPFDLFPLPLHRRYDPPLAPVEDYLAMLDKVGFARGVLVHSAANGFDNSCTGDALEIGEGRMAGVCVIQPGISDIALEQLHAEGFRAARFTETGGRGGHAGSARLDDLEHLAPRLIEMGWQAHLWANCSFTVAEAARLQSLGLPVVLDHMGYFDADLGVEDATFQSFLDLLRDSDIWVKLSVVRVSKQGANHSDVRPFHDALIAAIPDRLIFGSDWPYIGLDDAPPDVGDLVDLFDAWTPDAVLRHKILVANPLRLLGQQSP